LTPRILSVALVAVAVVEVVLPGRDLYHAGWFNVGIAALGIVAIVSGRRAVTNRRTHGLATIATGAGAAVATIAVVANGLFAPDNRTVVGAPGQQVRLDDARGVLRFPLVQRQGSSEAVAFDGPMLRSFVFKNVDRTVVAVEARDPRGARLTVTQPNGAAFLSPVLLMQQRQTIAGMNLPFDSFAVPAAHRVVKAVLFTPQQAALLRGTEGLEVPAVLFAVDDENDRPLPKAIVLSVNGQTVAAGGLLLRATVLDYPAVEVIAIPPPAVVALSALLAAGGMLWELASRRAAAGRSAP